MSQVTAPLAYAQANRPKFLRELEEFIRFPSVSARPEHSRDMIRCADWLANHLRDIPLHRVEVISTAGNPIVFAEWRHPAAAPTVIFYGHYDVQPADPIEQWHSPPFEPVVRGTNLYGRGASDDKGQLWIHVKAIESYLRSVRSLPLNVKFVFEGEEEVGSRNFASFLKTRKEALAANVVVISDMAMLAPDRPAITYSMRGALSLELEVAGAKADLHDGVFGGPVHNPVQGLCNLISCLQDVNGRIAVPGFYDRVREIGREERAYMKSVGRSEKQFLETAGINQIWGEPDYTPYEKTTIRPSLSATGIRGGYLGSGPKAIIPARASAKLNVRLVPDQDPAEIAQLIQKRVAFLTPSTLRSRMRTHFATKPVTVDRRHPAIRAAALACEKGFGTAPVFLRSGGSNPAVGAFQDVLGLPTVLLGFALPDDHIHAPNEKFHLPNFYQGIETIIRLLENIGHDVYTRNRSLRVNRNVTERSGLVV